MSQNFDAIIIGGGPGGYVAAIRTAQLGKKVALVEKRRTLGGTCLNVGCIPSKALLEASEFFASLTEKSGAYGIELGKPIIDVMRMQKRKDDIVREVCSGVDFLMTKNKITRIHGHACIQSGGIVEVTGENGEKSIFSAAAILIATGSEPASLPGVVADGERIITSEHALALGKAPNRLVIIGAGIIGLELGSVWRRLGSAVTFIEALSGFLPGADRQVASAALRIFQKQGLEFLFEQKVEKINLLDGCAEVVFQDSRGEVKKMTADKVLVAVGRRAYTEGLGLEKAGISLDEGGKIPIRRPDYQTKAAGIYAIGDVIPGPMLAHRASDEGIAWAENLCGQSGEVNYTAIPYIVYTWPEIAWVGQSEDELKEKGADYKTGKSFFRANARSKTMLESEGMLKVICDRKSDRILGVHILGPRASDLLAEAVLAMEFGGASEDIARTMHAHPTLSEIFREAALAADGRAIHG